TADPRITNALLYQLSQFGFFLKKSILLSRLGKVQTSLALRSLLQRFGFFLQKRCKGNTFLRYKHKKRTTFFIFAENLSEDGR
ncbi:MAG: hypothetical protein Q4E32_07050, partial [Bacteroidales bacterium]|nr:hypothetical protein [Bacteroidales bacterium]